MTTFVITEPQLMANVAVDLKQVGSAIGTARAKAVDATTQVVSAAEDEVSEATATLFNAYGTQYQAFTGQLSAFHEDFVAALATAGNAYVQAESEIATALGLTGGATPSTVITPKAVDPTVDAILVMTGSGTPTPSQAYIDNVASRFLTNFSGAVPTGLSTPEGLYPFTGVKDLTLDISLARGVTILDQAINAAITPGTGGGSIAVFGYSQSALLASMEMPKLLAEGFTPGQVHFTLIGDPGNPNGGVFARFPGLSIPSMGITFGTATPSSDFDTTVWTLEYDGFADFPRYPIDFLADLNAVAGILYVHGTYPTLSQAVLNTAITLPTSPSNTTGTYYMIPTQNLPLLDPLRAIPFIGNPLADLIQPDLRYLINWGYGDPNYGWSTSYADVPTPFGFLPPWSATAALFPDLIGGTQQGFTAFAADLSAEMPTASSAQALANAIAGATSPGGAFALPTASIPTTIDGIISGIQSANTNIVGTLTGDVATAYSTLLPTADIALALGVTLPSYDLNLFLDGIQQAVDGQPIQGLINAFGLPIAADVGLGTLAGGFELIAITNSLQTILTGVPNPGP